MQVQDIHYYFNLALSCFEKGNYDSAIENYKKALEFNSDLHQIYFNLANAYFSTNQHNLAIENYKKATELNPDLYQAFHYLGLNYAKKYQYNSAIECFKKVIDLKQDYFEAYNHLGISYHKQKQYEKAIEAYEKAIELKPDYSEAYKNIGGSYTNINCNKAIEYLKKSICLNPNDKEAYNNLAIAYYYNREIGLAIENYNKSLEIDPNFFEGYGNLSAALLIKGEFEKGWEFYEYRFFKESFKRYKLPKLSQPKWNGENIKDKTIYVYKEQGFGDTIMFSRYISLLQNTAKKVIFRPQPELKELFEKNYPEIQIIDNSILDKDIQFDVHIPLLSLPHMFKTDLNNIPSSGGYLKADTDKINSYKNTYLDNNYFKVGIYWYADPRYVLNKSTDLSYFYKLGQLPNVKLYSLQKGSGIEQLHNKTQDIDITDLGSGFNNYSDTAAAIANLDLVITVDTSVAHLAGAMGKPVWILLHTENEWRWMLNRNDSPWYKSAKLFRQRAKNNWNDVFESVYSELEQIQNSCFIKSEKYLQKKSR